MRTTLISKLVVGTVLGMLALSGCASAGSDISGGQASCPSPADLAPIPGSVERSTPVVVFIGQTGMMPASQDVSTVLNGAASIEAHIFVGGLGAGLAATPLQVNTVLVKTGANDSDRTTNYSCKTQLVSEAIATNANLPKTTKVDVFSALQNVQSGLTGSVSTEKNVIIDGSLLSTAGSINLATRGALDNPVATVNKVAEAQLLPRCKGWRVYAVNHPDPATGKALSDTDSSKLQAFWAALFHRCGGALVVWAPALTTFPVKTGAIQPADTAQIPIERRPDRVIATLSSDLSFDVGSAHLRTGAMPQLVQLLKVISSNSGPVVVDGYTDETGTRKFNDSLSRARSEAVSRWLEAHGVSAGRLHVAGHGSADPVAVNDSDAHRQANRRVTVTVFTTKA